MNVGLGHAKKPLSAPLPSPENTTTYTVSCIFVSLAIHASSISLYSLGFLGIAIIFME